MVLTTYAKTGPRGLLNKISYFCYNCNLHYNSKKLYTDSCSFGIDSLKNISCPIPEKTTDNTGNFISLNSHFKEKIDFKPKFYILNNINNQGENQSSGGVEALNNDIGSCIQPINLKGHTIRLSISPSQGDDPGFKSRPEHVYLKMDFVAIK